MGIALLNFHGVNGYAPPGSRYARRKKTPNTRRRRLRDERARVNEAIQEEASRVRVAAPFLPLFGPLAPDTDFVRAEIIPDEPRLRIQDRDTIQLATL